VNCCEGLQERYRSKPRGACGYGSSADEVGQFDGIRSCYVELNDGTKSESDVLFECAEQCRPLRAQRGDERAIGLRVE
jgi:hypothetical protein